MKGSRSVAWLVLVLLLAVGAGGAAFAKTINVAAGQSIQAAINAAATGDVVVVAEGTYTENITFGAAIIGVWSTNPTSASVVKATIINGNKQGSVVTFGSGAGPSALGGFTITNGSGTAAPDGYYYGGGVYCTGSSPTLTHDNIHGNTTTADGGGVYCYMGSPTLENNTISGNSADSGGGVACYNASPTLTNNTISGNSAGSCGGGVYCESSSPTLTYNTISGNSAINAHGGGVYCAGSSSPTLTNDTISGNSATWGIGGGVSCTASSPTLTNDTISGNSATYGGGVGCYASSSPVIKNTIIALSTKGAGLQVGDSTSKPVITYSDVYGNTGGNYVGFPHHYGYTGVYGNISKAPLFADPAHGHFHLKSQYGRWAPATKTWVLDTVTSPCIDAGEPYPGSAFNLEPAPNGGRINMGYDGDTKYASKSPSTTASAAAALTVSAASAQGLAGGRQALVFALSAPASVQVEIVNIAGRVIRELPAGDTTPAGVNTLSWDGCSTAGTPVPNGLYLARIVARTPDGAQAQAVVTCTVRR